MLADVGETFTYVISWIFLPGFVTTLLQNVYYGFRYNRETTPAAGTVRYKKDRERIYVFVILMYFGFVVYQIVRNLSPNYYDEIGVRPWEVDEKLRMTFKKLSLKYHPDRLINADEKTISAATETFMRMQKIYETLDDKPLRQAYERFGPIESQECLKCITFRDYLFNGIMQFIIYYAVIFVLNIILNFTSANIYGGYWRFTVLLAMAAFEASLLFAPVDQDAQPLILRFISNILFIGDKTTAQKIKVFRELTTNLLLAINLLGPILFPDPKSTMASNIAELQKAIISMGKDLKSSLAGSLKPFRSDESMRTLLMRKMEKIYLDYTLFERDADFRDLYKRQYKRD